MLLPQIYPVTCHTDHVGPGSTFVAITGFKLEGNNFIQAALEKGATRIITEKTPAQELKIKYPETQWIIVPNARLALAHYASEALKHPAQKLKIIGITGTSGKTTTSYLINHILRKAGHRTALLGSIKNQILDDCEENEATTTPASDYFHMFLAECIKKSVEYVIMEVSSQALAVHRVENVLFNAVGFTNLSPEHLDYHKTMDHYFSTKLLLFEKLKPNARIVINSDDEWGNKACNFLVSQKKITPQLFGTHDNTPKYHTPHFQSSTPRYCSFAIKQNTLDGLVLALTENQEKHILSCPVLCGEFNGYNIMMAYLICTSCGISPQIITHAIKNFPGVPGRLQLHTLNNGARAFVDFAHKPDAFEKVLKTLRPYTDHLIVVFGCGGNRDQTKRPVMGKAASTYADKVIITDDNPRNEEREKIVHDIMAGIPTHKHKEVIQELDRHKAIECAVKESKASSIIALLGKGHETHYLINGKSLHFDDFEEISKY